MKEINVKRLHTVRFQLYDILEKAKQFRDSKDSKKKKNIYISGVPRDSIGEKRVSR